MLTPCSAAVTHAADLRTVAPGATVGPGPAQFLPELPRLRAVVFGTDLGPGTGNAPDAAVDAAIDAAFVAALYAGAARRRHGRDVHLGEPRRRRASSTPTGAPGVVEARLVARGCRAAYRLYIPMPFFWMGGFGAGLLSALVAGSTLITEAEPEPARMLASSNGSG